MNCRRFRSEIEEMLRQGRIQDPIRPDMERHARACPGCAARLERELLLAEAFRELGLSLEQERASDSVGERLRRSFLETAHAGPSRKAEKRRAPRVRFQILAAAVILAAVLGAGTVVLRRAILDRDRNQEQMPKISLDELGGLGVDSLPAANTDFIDLGGCGDLDCWEGSQLLRIKMPRSSLLYFGLPMNDALANDRISADVLIGRDGMAHAIRFVQITERYSTR